MKTEREIYEHMWSLPRYRRVSFGERNAAEVEVAPGERVICVGCGTGREGIVLEARGAVVTLQDLVPTSRDPEAMRFPFIEGDAAEISGRWDLVFSSDFLEHLPPDRVAPVLERLAAIAPRSYLVADCAPDAFGPMTIGEPLHKTIQPPSWWGDVVRGYWGTVATWSRGSKVYMECRA